MINNKRIGFGITGSFCTHKDIIKPLKELVEAGNEVVCVLTPAVYSTDTRFGKAKEFISLLEDITGNKVVTSVVEAEGFGPKNPFDIFIIAPITACSLAKMANGLTDNAVLMAQKATMRNNRPVVLSIASNDALGLSGCNIMKLIATKNVFFVPFGQDDPVNKPNSMISDVSQLVNTVEKALSHEQLQPVVISHDGSN